MGGGSDANSRAMGEYEGSSNWDRCRHSEDGLLISLALSTYDGRELGSSRGAMQQSKRPLRGPWWWQWRAARKQGHVVRIPHDD
jgi:hypothetical protein